MQGSANAELFEGLLMLQHRGQDSAGMVTYDGHRFCEHKDNGLVNDVFGAKTVKQLRGGSPTPHPALYLLNITHVLRPHLPTKQNGDRLTSHISVLRDACSQDGD